MRVWIDLTNSPHVLVMRPVIEVLRARGDEVRVTARDFAQTVALCERFGIEHEVIGRHRGSRLAAKALGLADRSLALDALGTAPGASTSRSGTAPTTSAWPPALLRIPCSTMFDYEWATVQHNVNCRLAQAVVVPEAIPPERLYRYGARRKLRRYAGLKEEYYLAGLRARSGRARASWASIPPSRSPWCAHRPRSRSTTASRTTCSPPSCSGCAGTQTVVLPRVAAQRATQLRRLHRARAGDRRPVAGRPADLVISAGGTMNREAVALGTPVWTTFEGRPGAVDERLIAEGRLRRLERPEQLELVKRTRSGRRARAPRSRAARRPALLARRLTAAPQGARPGADDKGDPCPPALRS